MSSSKGKDVGSPHPIRPAQSLQFRLKVEWQASNAWATAFGSGWASVSDFGASQPSRIVIDLCHWPPSLPCQLRLQGELELTSPSDLPFLFRMEASTISSEFVNAWPFKSSGDLLRPQKNVATSLSFGRAQKPLTCPHGVGGWCWSPWRGVQ